ATSRFSAAFPLMVCPFTTAVTCGVPMFASVLQSFGPIGELVAKYGLRLAGTGVIWFKSNCRVRCVPLLPTYETVATVFFAMSCCISKCDCCMYGHFTLS